MSQANGFAEVVAVMSSASPISEPTGLTVSLPGAALPGHLVMSAGGEALSDPLALRTMLADALGRLELAHRLARQAQDAAAGAIGERDAARQELKQLQQDGHKLAAEAEFASLAKSEFVATLGHQMRTHLTAIQGFAEILLHPRVSPTEMVNAVRTIRSNAGDLLQVMDDTMQVLHLEMNQCEVRHTVCSPIKLLVEVGSILSGKCQENHLTFDLHFLGELPETIQTDPVRLRQILLGLAGYSLHTTRHGAIRMTVQFSDQGPEPVLRIELIDSGQGMSAAQVRSIIEPFGCFDPQPLTEEGALLLRLRVAHQLAHLLGGGLEIDSTQQQGTTFRLTVSTGPLEGVALVDAQEEALTLRRKEGALRGIQLDQVLRGTRMLLAEDGPDNRRLITMILGKAGAEVEAVPDGQKAVEAITSAWQAGRPYDLVLMDMQMPVLDGYAATRTLRQQGYRGTIIALTAHVRAGERERCLAAGCDDYASKPIDRIKLITLLHDWLQQAKSAVPTDWVNEIEARC